MKKIIFIILLFIFSIPGYSQLLENFEAATGGPDAVSGVWTLSSGDWLVRDNRSNTGQNWKLNTPQAAFPANSIPNAAFIDRENTGQGILAEEWLITPQINVLANYQFRFFTRQTSPGDTGTLYQIRVSDDPDRTNLAAYTVLQEYTELTLSTITSTQLDYEEKIINLTTTGNKYFAFVKVFTQPGIAIDGDRWLVDDVKLIQRCPDPTGLNVDGGVTGSTAVLGWTGTATTYQIEYGLSGFVLGTGTVFTGVTGNTFTLGNGIPASNVPLQPTTAYQFYITGVCQNGNSVTVGPFNFVTGEAPPACGGVYSDPGGQTANYPNNANNTVTICPAIPGQVVTVTFTSFDVDPTNDGLLIYDGSSVSAPQISSGNPAGGGPLTGIPGAYWGTTSPGTITSTSADGCLTFRFLSDDFTTAPGFIANIVCSDPPPCRTPGNFTVSAVTSTNATLTWVPLGTPLPTSFQVIAVDCGAPAPTDASAWITVTGNTYTYSVAGGNPLLADHCYNFYVRSNCGAEGFSIPAGPRAATTQIAPPVCGGSFSDPGGSSGDYTNEIDQTITICPTNPGDVVTVTFTSFNTETNWDGLLIYDGNSTASPQISSDNGTGNGFFATVPGAYWGTASPGVITSSSADGCLTFRFVSDTSGTFPGWTSNVTCGPPPPCRKPTAFAVSAVTSNQATLTWTAVGTPQSFEVIALPCGSAPPTNTSAWIPATGGSPFVLNTTLIPDTCYDFYVRAICGADGNSDPAGPRTFTTQVAPPVCGGTFTDPGGISANYANLLDSTVTICPANPGDIVTVTFTSFDTEENWDGLLVYDGNSTNAPQISSDNGTGFGFFATVPGAFWGTAGPGTITSSSPDGCLTFRFVSDGVFNEAGWTANVICAPAPPCRKPTALTVTDVTSTNATLSWTSVGTPASFEVIALPCGSPIPTDASAWLPSAGSPFIFNALTPDTCYDFYVRAVCGADGVSEPAGPKTRTTQVAPPVCGGTFSDPGGVSADYQVNTDSTVTVCPINPGDIVTVTFTSFSTEAQSDGLLIYDGSSIASPQISSVNGVGFGFFADVPGAFWGTGSPGTITSSSPDGCLTFRFVSDGFGTDPGWTANVVCSPAPPCRRPTAFTVSTPTSAGATLNWIPVNNPESFSVIAVPCGSPEPAADNVLWVNGVTGNTYTYTTLQYDTCYDFYIRANCGPDGISDIVGPQSITTLIAPPVCGGTFSDQGGVNGPYPGNSDNTVTICPTAPGQRVSVTFTSFDVEDNFDGLLVYNGNSTAAPQISSTNGPGIGGIPAGAFWGNISPGTVTSTSPDGCLTFRFISDDFGNLSGWTGFVECVFCDRPTNLQATVSDTHQATLSWSEAGTATSWEVSYAPYGAGLPTTPGVIVSGTPVYTTTVPDPGLAPGIYEFYVRAICGGPGEFSGWAGPYSFFVSAGPITCASVEITPPVIGGPADVVDFCNDDSQHCIDLTASYVPLLDTSAYAVAPIGFAPPFPFTGGIELDISIDDIWGPAFTLPFNFCYFGQNYTEIQVGSNGVITFDADNGAGGYCPWPFTTTIPDTTFPIKNAIFGVYQDLNPAVSSAPVAHNINYSVVGVEPCRAFVVNYFNVPQFSCGTGVGLQTSQVVLYETSNIVEVYIQDRTSCTTWNGGNGVVGIMNDTGTVAYVPPGRNTGTWTAHNEAWRFTPDGQSNVQFSWLQGGVPISNETSINVCVTETTNFTAQATYTGCGGDTVVKTADILLRVNDLPVIDFIDDVHVCEAEFLPSNLPELPAGQAYFTQAGGLEPIDPTIPLTADQTLYVYAQTETTPPCTAERSFQLIFNPVTLPEQPEELVGCTEVALPPLPAPFAYYPDVDGQGGEIPVGTVYNAPATIYIFGANDFCFAQRAINIALGQIPPYVVDDVTTCGNYILPQLSQSDIYSYYTLPGGPTGGGTELAELLSVSTSQTVYVYGLDGTCQSESQFDITITESVTPLFDPVSPLCLNAPSITLSNTSQNTPPVIGTWTNGGVIETDTEGTTVYTFNPDTAAFPCAVPITLSVTVNAQITPLFNTITPCVNATVVLPTTSTNSVVGSWNVPNVDTSTSGTTTYTFTPDLSLSPCAVPTMITVTVVDNVTPTFTQIPNICQFTTGPTLPTLPTTSNNTPPITGTWNPSVIDTSTAGTFTYTFTPDAQFLPCATTATMDITIDPAQVPTFDPIGPLCQNSTAPLLLLTSLEGITGTWNPATISTSTVGTTAYIFTPDPSQPCTATASISITVIPQIIPNFPTPLTFCAGDTIAAFETESPNGVQGTWNPVPVDNQTGATYTFTPNAGQCAVPQIITVNITPRVTPTFAPIADFCQGDNAPVLPATSIEGIAGSWSPAVIDNQVFGTFTYTFLPAAGQCADNGTISVIIIERVTPTFDPIASFCSGAVVPVLPTTSLNGIAGTWNPSVIDNAQVGDSQYIFTPAAGICASSVTITVTVTDLPEFTITSICEEGQYVIRINPTNGFDPDNATYSWNLNGQLIPNANSSSLTAGATGIYTVIVSNGNCSSPGQDHSVTSISCTIQKGISPRGTGSGDGKNDFFDLVGRDVSKLEIFNRYGTRVYGQAKYTNQWFGQSDEGNELPDGTYYYVIDHNSSDSETGWIYINREQ